MCISVLRVLESDMFQKHTLLFVLAILVFIPSVSYAQSTGSLSVFIKSENGDRVPPEGLSLKIYRNVENSPTHQISSLGENPVTIGKLSANDRYKVEVYSTGMYAGVGFVDMKASQEQTTITIKNMGGLRLNVFYSDGQTPISGAHVSIKSNDGHLWSSSETDLHGNTLRAWLYPTVRQGDHYLADITIAKDIVYRHGTISLLPGVAQDLKVVTNWPTVVDRLFTVEVFNNTKTKVGKVDGKFTAELYDRNKNKVAESAVTDKGLAYFSKLKVNNYQLYIKLEDESGTMQTVASKLITVTGSSDTFKIYLNNPELNSDHLNCNCVAFRLDDVQDYFLSPAQLGVISTFEQKQAPLTVGVIGSLIGTDPNLVNTIKTILAKNDGSLEIANHSWNNRILTQMPQSEQEVLITDANKKIQSIFGVTPRVFIPPENVFNNDTLSILKDNGFTHLSSAMTNSNPPPFTKSDFYQFPIVPYTASLDASRGIWISASNENILDKIDESIFEYGYAVVMMHPYEFSMYDNGYVNKINATKLADLGSLIDTVRSRNIRIMALGEIQNYDVDEARQPTSAKNVDVGCNCVAFRLDNIQDFWLNDVQGTIIDTFDKNRIPLTLAVLGKFIGDDPKTVDQIKQKLKKTSPINIANKGWEHVDHTAFDKEAQTSSMLQTSEKIENVFNTRASIFSPPYDSFNKDTLDAMRQANLAYLSASIIRDAPPYPNDSIKHIPSTVTFANAMSDDPFLNGTLRQKALYKVQSSVDQYGFAVVSLQSSDLAVQEDTFQNTVDKGKLTLLQSMIADIKSSGLVIVDMKQIPILLDDDAMIVPGWIKTNAGWWAESQISDSEFTAGLEYLIGQRILKVPASGSGDSGEKDIPGWIKTNAGWWAENKITDSDFVRGIQYLIENGIITI